MRLTGFVDVALRILIRLATLESGQQLSTRSIADEMRMSYAHATKACAHLAGQGWLIADRGRGGGVALSESGRNARLGEVVRSLQGEGEMVDCAGLECPLQSGCRLRRALATAQAAFYDSLNTTTVGDLANPPTRALVLSLTVR